MFPNLIDTSKLNKEIIKINIQKDQYYFNVISISILIFLFIFSFLLSINNSKKKIKIHI